MDKILKSILKRQIPFLIGGTITGTMAALAALLFISRGRRTRSRSAEISENVPSSSSSKLGPKYYVKFGARYTIYCY